MKTSTSRILDPTHQHPLFFIFIFLLGPEQPLQSETRKKEHFLDWNIWFLSGCICWTDPNKKKDEPKNRNGKKLSKHNTKTFSFPYILTLCCETFFIRRNPSYSWEWGQNSVLFNGEKSLQWGKPQPPSRHHQLRTKISIGNEESFLFSLFMLNTSLKSRVLWWSFWFLHSQPTLVVNGL